MSKKIKKTITISIIVIVIIIAIISTFFIVRHFKNKSKIDNVCKIYSDDNVQDRLDNENITTKDDLLLQIDGESVVGVIKIEQIDFEGLIYEGTSLATLAKGVGHFENSSYYNGNVCLAAHNTNKFWAKLHTLHTGDKISYISFLGTKEYYVNSITQIDENDWSNLENTEENTLTLITCVKGKPSLRLCVQALEL
ncbi:MAG TPA: class D sortase [Clostridiaceae bacterium]|nr:class D sortase [Clostridiaceae bacterium]HJJ19383.1 class D sortase [Clostridiaceae bacterium]